MMKRMVKHVFISCRRLLVSGPESRTLPKVVGFTGSALGVGVAYYQFMRPKLLAATPFNDQRGNRRSLFNFLTEVVKETKGGLVNIWIKNPQGKAVGEGSGFFVESEGLILTNAHVVKYLSRYTILVQTHDGRFSEGIVEAVDESLDLAVIRVNLDNCPLIRLGDSGDVQLGEFVLALGSPLSLQGTVTFGTVSYVARSKCELQTERDVNEYIQTSINILSGNSGGPLVNLDGQVIGINTMNLSNGIAFAIPINYAKKFLEIAKSQKRLHRVGASTTFLTNDVTDHLKKVGKISGSVKWGLYVYDIINSSPAFNAGLRAHDVIVEFDGKPIRSKKEFHEIMENSSNNTIKLKVVRDSNSFHEFVLRLKDK